MVPAPSAPQRSLPALNSAVESGSGASGRGRGSAGGDGARFASGVGCVAPLGRFFGFFSFFLVVFLSFRAA